MPSCDGPTIIRLPGTTLRQASRFEDCFARLSLPASSIRTWPELRAQLKHMGKVPRGWWFGGFQLCSFLSPKMVRSAPRGPSIPAPRADRHGAACRYPFVGGFCFLVATPRVQDLLLSAKHLFVGARPFEP